MASSDNLIASTETWAFRSAFDNAWISEAFSRDTEILTRALQHSISNTHTTTTTTSTNNNNNNDHVHVNNVNNNASLPKAITSPSLSPSGQQTTTTQTHSVSSSGGNSNGSEAETVSKKRASFRNVFVGPKITKRKSRASKRSPTTFITADPENFRQMVQQVTGVRFAPGSNHLVKPEPHRPAGVVNRLQTGGFLPTLDTSAFLLDHQNQQQGLGLGPTGVDFGPPAVVAEASGPRFDFDGFSGFPTLESWN